MFTNFVIKLIKNNTLPFSRGYSWLVSLITTQNICPRENEAAECSSQLTLGVSVSFQLCVPEPMSCVLLVIRKQNSTENGRITSNAVVSPRTRILPLNNQNLATVMTKQYNTKLLENKTLRMPKQSFAAPPYCQYFIILF